MPLAQLVDAVDRGRATTKKSEKVRLLAEVLRQTSGQETTLAALYLSGSLPQGKIGIGWNIIQRAMQETPSLSPTSPGVLGSTGEPLTLLEIDRVLGTLASERGSGSTERRVTELGKLFSRAKPKERQFLSQLIIGEIRQGALEGVLLDAIAVAAELPPANVREASMFAPNIGELAQAALEKGSSGLAGYSLRLFDPVAPMLANSAADVDEALDRLERAAFEYKLDGARIQVHKSGDEVRLF